MSALFFSLSSWRRICDRRISPNAFFEVNLHEHVVRVLEQGRPRQQGRRLRRLGRPHPDLKLQHRLGLLHRLGGDGLLQHARKHRGQDDGPDGSRLTVFHDRDHGGGVEEVAEAGVKVVEVEARAQIINDLSETNTRQQLQVERTEPEAIGSR